MIPIQPSRRQPNRAPSGGQQPAAQTVTYPAPVGGWVTDQNLLAQNQSSAAVLENFWPTTRGLEPRGGTKRRVTIPNKVEALFEYRAGGHHFVADESNVYKFTETTLDGTVLTPIVTGQTSGDYAHLETQTAGGSFLSIVNGRDPMQLYDGTGWQAVTDTSSPHAITVLDTDKISHLWAYRNRTFMIEQGTMNAWYLGVNAVSGTATKLPLAGLFTKGGALSFGATWSSDSGSGMDDRCVFATTEGEFAVFSGDPSSATEWVSAGVFDLGEPLDPRAHMSVGGDLIIATKAGLIPISAAMEKDVAQLKLSALSRNIDPDWRQEVINAGRVSGWRLVKWDSRNMAILAPPKQAEQGYCFAVNLETGAWTKFTGWLIDDIQVMGGVLFYGDANGIVYQCDIGGTDDGNLIPCKAQWASDGQGRPDVLKRASMAVCQFQYSTPFLPKMSIATDFNTDFPTPPNASQESSSGGAQWDASEWDVTPWGGFTGKDKVLRKRTVVSGHGHVLAPQLQIVSGASFKLDCELISVDLHFTAGQTPS